MTKNKYGFNMLPDKTKVFAGILITIVVLAFVGINVTTPVTVQQQTVQTATGTSTVTVKACDSTLPIIVPQLCQLSTNQGNKTISSSDCPNGGVKIAGTCPASIVPLPSNTTLGTTPQPPSNPNAEQIQIIPNVTIVDSNGVKTTTSTNSLSLPLQSFFGLDLVVTHDTNTPLIHGQILVGMTIHASANEKIIANGTLWVSLNNNLLNPAGLPWAVNAVTGSDGNLIINIGTPVGTVTQYNFDIDTNRASLMTGQNNLNFTISNTKIQNGKGQSYNNNGMQKLYQTTIDSDPNMVIQQNSDGKFVRIPNSDDTFTISTIQKLTGYQYLVTNQCAGRYCSFNIVGIYSGGVPAGIASIYQEGSGGFEKLIGSTTDLGGSTSMGCGYGNAISTGTCGAIGTSKAGNSQTVSNIPRDSDIRIVITGGSAPISKIMHTPLTQMAYTFTCDTSSCTNNFGQ